MHLPARALLIASCTVASAAVAVAPAGASTSSAVRIAAVYFDSPGSDTGSNSSRNGEWVLVHNGARTARTLTGWTLRDAQRHVYRFPTYRLGAGKSVKVHTGSGRNTATDLYWGSRTYIWNNTGDRAVLRTATGSTVGSCSFTRADAPKKVC